jgi:hypothetical protein
MGAPCTVCKNPGVRKVVDGYYGEGMTGAGISRALAGLGLKVSPEVVNGHGKHYAPPPERLKGTPKKDFAIVVRDKAYDQLEAGDLDLADKDQVAGINAGLKAQALIDKREAIKAKVGTAELAWALLGMLTSPPELPQLEDGLTVEGTFQEVEPDGEVD